MDSGPTNPNHPNGTDHGPAGSINHQVQAPVAVIHGAGAVTGTPTPMILIDLEVIGQGRGPVVIPAECFMIPMGVVFELMKTRDNGGVAPGDPHNPGGPGNKPEPRRPILLPNPGIVNRIKRNNR